MIFLLEIRKALKHNEQIKLQKLYKIIQNNKIFRFNLVTVFCLLILFINLKKLYTLQRKILFYV